MVQPLEFTNGQHHHQIQHHFQAHIQELEKDRVSNMDFHKELEDHLLMDQQLVSTNGIPQHLIQLHFQVHIQELVKDKVSNTKLTILNHYKDFWINQPLPDSMILKIRDGEHSQHLLNIKMLERLEVLVMIHMPF